MSLFWMAVITFAILQTSVFFTTIYLHRCKTHRGLELHPAIGLLMHLELSLFTGIVPREWAAVHRKHHHFSDKEGDPHSPYIYGMWTVLFGNYFFYRRETKNASVIQKYTPDWKDDFFDRFSIMQWGSFGGLAIFMAMFGIWWGAAAWLTHAVVYVLLNSAINSVCHMIGYRNFNNKATNLQWIALLTGGEGLHNNHHQYPSSALFALRRREIDLAWPVIRLLEVCGLAKVSQLPVVKAAA
jgi:stearoyl-CoA desaturase (delta-9 desaturase)